MDEFLWSDWKASHQLGNDFERTVHDDGYVLVKFWLHISKEEQARRFRKLAKDPLKSWHVTDEDWEHHAKYDPYLIAVEEMLERTETEWGPWTIVEATNRWWARTKVITTIIDALRVRLGEKGVLGPDIDEQDDDFVDEAELEADDAGLREANDDREDE